MKRYEGLFILNNTVTQKEDGVKEAIDKITAEINHTGGKVETVQKMDKRPFVRVANKKNSAGFYVNFIFSAEPSAIGPLRSRFVLNEDVFRVLFTAAQAPKEPAKEAR